MPSSRQWQYDTENIILEEISKLIQKGVLVKCVHELDEFLSTIFLRQKKNGGYRMILNLSQFSHYVVYKHFKMDTLFSTLQLVKQYCFFTSIDLQDAYYSVPVAQNCQKYLKFVWHGNCYKYVCLPQGLSSAPRIFTKI